VTRYATIVADPPWDMGKHGRYGGTVFAGQVKEDLPYPTMTVDAIKALPVATLAAENAHLYLWTVNRYLEDAYAIARAWGFRPAQLLTWAKTPMGKGNGGAFSQTTEHCIFARRGTLAHLQRHPSTWWNWPRPRKAGDCHSRKPEAFLDLVEQISPPPFLEMFARDRRLGWDSWGNEVNGVTLPLEAA
jgi:N6-adenosine-specific RNA methylase IME4